MQHIRVDDILLGVLAQGEEGPPLVLVHGFPLTHAMWQPQIDCFKKTCRVIAPDLRGFGASELGSKPASMEQMADDLNGLLDALHVTDRVVFCGLSMGGYVGWEFWRKYRHRLAGLIQCDTRAVPDTPEVAKGRAILAAKVMAEGAKVAAEAMLPKLFGPKTTAGQAHLLASVRQMIEGNSPAGIAAALAGMAGRRDSRELLAQIDVPTLVIVGEHDAISTVDEMDEIAAAIPNSQRVTIADAGHLSTLENPAAVNEAIAGFFLGRIATA